MRVVPCRFDDEATNEPSFARKVAELASVRARPGRVRAFSEVAIAVSVAPRRLSQVPGDPGAYRLIHFRGDEVTDAFAKLEYEVFLLFI